MDTSEKTPDPEENPEPKRPSPWLEKHLLENECRKRIMDALTRIPGMNKHQVTQAIGMSRNAVEYHLRRLAEVGLVRTRKALTGTERLCFTVDNVDLWDDESTRVLYGRSPPRQVALYLTENPGSKASDVAKALGSSQNMARRNLRTLEACQLVQRTRVDRRIFYHPKRHLTDWAELVASECERKWRT